jgi:hypothetical protein
VAREVSRKQGRGGWAWLGRAWLRIVSALGPGGWLLGLVRRRTAALRTELEGKLTDKFVELLLVGMDLAFLLLPSYRRNLHGFRGSYLFRTADGLVAASASFAGGRMVVDDGTLANPTATVIFRDAAALRRFLFSKDQDILNSILASEVEVVGNLNYVYKFGFMARDLVARLG